MSTIEETLAERGDRYGNFMEHAKIAQTLQDVARGTAGWSKLAYDQKQALTVIFDKIARMLNGQPGYRDNWHDIVGYAKLVDDRMAADEGARLTTDRKGFHAKITRLEHPGFQFMHEKFMFLAKDESGGVYAYRFKPSIDEEKEEWVAAEEDVDYTEIHEMEFPFFMYWKDSLISRYTT